MIADFRAGLTPPASTENAGRAEGFDHIDADASIPYVLASAPVTSSGYTGDPAPLLIAQWAVQLPGGGLWCRTGTTIPRTFTTRAAAERATGPAAAGARLMVRAVITTASGSRYGRWQPATAPAVAAPVHEVLFPRAYAPLDLARVPASPLRCADTGPLTTAQARRVLAEHIDCPADPGACRIRTVAMRVLLAARPLCRSAAVVTGGRH